MLRAIENIRQIAQLCRAEQKIPQPLADWLAESLQQFLEHRCPTVDDAFGVRNGRGGVPWWMEVGLRARDAALRELAHRHLAPLSVSARSVRIHELSVRYAASAWRFDRMDAAMPAHYRGTPSEWLWRAFKSGAAMPLGERQLRKVLGR